MSVGPSTLPPKCIACFENLGSAKYAPVSLHFWTYKVAQKHEQFWLLFIQVQLWFDTIYIKSDIYTLRHDIHVFVLLDISRTTCPLINFTFYFVILSLSLRAQKSQTISYEPNFLFVYAYTLCQGHKMRFRRFYCYKMHTPQSLFFFFVRKIVHINSSAFFCRNNYTFTYNNI